MIPGGLELTATDIALKDATAAAVAVDKQVYVARIMERAQSVVNDWGNSEKAGFIPLRLVPHLERLGQGRAGWPHITRALAHMQGFELFPLPEVETDARDWMTQVGAVSTEAAEIVTKICASLADDQRVCAQDVKKHGLLDDAEQLVAIAVQLLTQLRAVSGEQ
jgi:hypothetical protein